ncbi:NAD(P)-dependent oxidoreductase [Terrarubrum flagellatum]|uniref:NAD(P)-dependent oxidoreductase n=1 Tax=Terrirubrum flagellatum TaxID=2895980 RepID=UPI00314535B4
MTNSHPPLAYLGLGLMGLPMTQRLLAAGCSVSVWNRSAAKCEPAIASGARAAASPRAAAEAADIIFMCLTDASAVEEVIFGEGGVAEAAGDGKIVVDFSSIHPEKARSIAERLKTKNGMRWIDAPVSGGVKGAAEGTLAVMAGGDAADIKAVEGSVLLMAARFTHMGPVGAGQTTKLCNQIIAGCAMTVLAEATRLAKNAGIDAARLPEAFKGGFADSIPLQLFVPRMANDIYSPPIGYIATILKDLDTVLDVAQKTGSPAPMTGLAAQLFRMAQASRGAGADALEVFKLSEPAAR